MKLKKRLKLAIKVYRDSGPRAVWHLVKRFVYKRVHGWSKVSLSVDAENIEAADWTKQPEVAFRPRGKGPYTINWVIPTASGGSGGHQNIFRFVRGLEAKGHKCRLYFYDALYPRTAEETKMVLEKHFPPMKAEISDDVANMKPCDAIFATSWQTAYPVFNFKTDAKKFYFVQDFEPYFYPVGSESVLAENTYKFGFFGITAGGWLAKKLHDEYGMQTENYDFGSDHTRYTYENAGQRKSIFFYARPVTARRGFELGVLALEMFAKQHPDYELLFAGWDVGDYKLPFKFKNLGILNIDELNEMYNQCAAGLVVSLTNMSLTPLELLAAGCIPVVNDAPNNRLVTNNPFIAYADPSPAALARALSDVVERPDLPDYARKASESASLLDWQNSVDKFEHILERELHG